MDRQNEKEITTVPELAEMIKNSFQGNQEYMDEMKKELKKEIKGVDGRLIGIDDRLIKVEKKLDGFIDGYNEDKLPMRLDYIENVLNIPKK